MSNASKVTFGSSSVPPLHNAGTKTTTCTESATTRKSGLCRVDGDVGGNEQCNVILHRTGWVWLDKARLVFVTSPRGWQAFSLRGLAYDFQFSPDSAWQCKFRSAPAKTENRKPDPSVKTPVVLSERSHPRKRRGPVRTARQRNNRAVRNKWRVTDVTTHVAGGL